MDYGALLRRSWEIVWNNKWLILLGVLIVLGSGNSFSTRFNFPGGGGGGPGGGNFNTNDNFSFTPPESGQLPDFSNPDVRAALGIGIPILIAVLCIGGTIVLICLFLARISTGGSIHAVDILDSGGVSSFGQAFGAGWGRGWTLIGIGIIAAIPMLVLVIIILALIIPIAMVATTVQDVMTQVAAASGLLITLIALGCLTAIVGLILTILRTFADRAAMLDGTGVFESYRRGWEVLRSNAGEALIIALIQIGGTIGLKILLFVPLAIASCCCLFWPVLLVFGGLVQAYLETMWTLAWRKWTGRAAPLTGPAADVAPAAPAV